MSQAKAIAIAVVGIVVVIAAAAGVVRYERSLGNSNVAQPAEFRKIVADRMQVERWVVKCLNLSAANLPPAGLNISEETLKPDKAGKPMDVGLVHPGYFRVSALNNALAERRVAFDVGWADAFFRAELATWVTVLIGLLTTAMVALSTTSLVSKADNKGRWITLSALVLPAIGTAVAAIVAFYEPSAVLASRKAVAASAEQLHLHMTQNVWALKCFAKADDELGPEQKALFDSWSQRFQDLVSRTEAKSGAAGGDTKSSAAGPTKP